jgi:hypothetical protein
MKTMRIAGGLIVGAGLLLAVGQAEADWRYTDDKGQSRTVPLKMDVPRQYSNTAVEVDGSAHGSNTLVPAGALTLPVPVPEQQPTVPPVLVPGKMWWSYPVGSPERAAAQHEASAKAYSLRQQAGTTTSFNEATVACMGISDSFIAMDKRKYGVATKEDSYAYFSKCMASRGHPVGNK